MNKTLAHVSRYMSLLLYGISTMTIQPQVDYMVHVSSAEEMTRKSWERTGNMLKDTINMYEVGYGKKQATANAQG